MFYSLVLEFYPEQAITVTHDLGRGLHGLLFYLLRACDEEYAARIHSQSGRKPFTVSPLRVAQGLDGNGTIPAGRLCRVRFTLLEDRPFGRLTEFLLGFRSGGQSLHLAGIPVVIRQVTVTGGGAGDWTGYAEPGQIYEAARARESLTLEFASPTTFRQGDKNLPLPVPRLVYGGLAAKWRDHCPDLPLNEGLPAFIEGHVFPAAYRLETSLLNYGRGSKFVGFVGTCTFGLSGEDLERYPLLAAQVDLLSRFAFFAGVGQKTTMGMGQCRVRERQSNTGRKGG